ncbi:transposase [Chitinophaga sp. YR573]|uniref:IS256 family transposase n=1 Tax=Chitinophaga sp. YR573 TaxID=1881040 RepID=UPI000A85BA30|nr:transposase [Chitinophaga sp. YR573]
MKVRENSKVINKTVHIAVGLRRDGLKEVLGMWLGKNESAAYWMSVLTDMKARGLEDILITATDNLNGFTQTIRSIFPDSATQICVVHQIRNSCRYVVWKDKKEFTTDLKDIYTAPTRQAALAGLDSLYRKRIVFEIINYFSTAGKIVYTLSEMLISVELFHLLHL